MGIAGRAKNAAQDLTGKAKEAVGDTTNNERLVAEGKADQGEATMKTRENVKNKLS